jgi:hypothetical protein
MEFGTKNSRIKSLFNRVVVVVVTEYHKCVEYSMIGEKFVMKEFSKTKS